MGAILTIKTLFKAKTLVGESTGGRIPSGGKMSEFGKHLR